MEKKCHWRECVNWLVRCEVLRPDHQTCQSEAHLEDVAYTLRDGVLLCRLVNTLVPDCISVDKVHLNPQNIKCLCVQNIKIFLKACQDVFGLKESDLFDPAILFDLSGFHKVLSTLSYLSNTPKALDRTPQGFNTRLSGIELQIREIDSRRSFELSENASLSTQRESIRQDAIYEKLIFFKGQEFPGNNTRRKEKRDFIIEEILTNEKSYLQGVLKTVLDSFMKPLKSVLGIYDIQAIFGSLELLADFHGRFYEELQKTLSIENNFSLGNVFVKYYEDFLMYGEYCANLPGALELLKTLTKKELEVKYMLEKCQAGLKNGRFFLSDLLVVPMQHILKYRLLLDRLRRETNDDHPEHDVIQEAHEKMTDVNNYVNDVKRDREALQTIEKIERKIIDLNIPGNKTLKDFGHLHKDDELRIKFQDHKIGSRYVFVFDKNMLICKSLKDGSYACQEVLQLSCYKIKDSVVQGSSRFGYQWILAHKKENIEYIIFARNEAHKHAWMRALSEALDNIQPSYARENGHIFNVNTFERPTLCHLCFKSLKGLIMQGYTCQFCCISVHKTCLKDADTCGAVQQHRKEQTELPPPRYGDVKFWNDYRFLGQYEWFVGLMQRPDADKLLCQQRRGTYLVRIRPKYRLSSPINNGQPKYVISLKTIDEVIHMLVYERISNGAKQYYLSEARYFPTIVELVDYYRHWSIQENFEEYGEVLNYPIGEMSETNTTPINTSTTLEEDQSEEFHDYFNMDKLEEKTLPNYPKIDETPQECDQPDVLGCSTSSLVSSSMLSDDLKLTRIDSSGNHKHGNERGYSKQVNIHHDVSENRLCEFRSGESRTTQNERSTQTSHDHMSINQLNDDIEAFGEYVVVALKLVKNRSKLKEITSQIRKLINDKLDEE